MKSKWNYNNVRRSSAGNILIKKQKMLVTIITCKILLTVFVVGDGAPMLFPNELALSSTYNWPLWNGGPYLYHPSIRWATRPPIVYIWPVLDSHSSVESPKSTSATEPAQNRLFPTYKKPSKQGIRNQATDPEQLIGAEHRELNETDVDMEIEDDYEFSSRYTNESNSNETSLERTKRQVIFPETHSSQQPKHFSQSGKLVFEGLSMLGSALAASSDYAASAYNRPIAPPIHYPSYPIHPSFPQGFPPPHPPLFGHQFMFPGPSALYPQLPQVFPLGANGQHYYPAVPSPYKALSVDSLLVPLVGMVGLSLLVPDIVKTRREGRPSDFDGLDVYRMISEDGECLKRLACEAGVVIDPNDDPETIKRSLERGWAAKSAIPPHHYNKDVTNNCGSHNCELNWSSSSSTPSINLDGIGQRSSTSNQTQSYESESSPIEKEK